MRSRLVDGSDESVCLFPSTVRISLLTLRKYSQMEAAAHQVQLRGDQHTEKDRTGKNNETNSKQWQRKQKT